MLSLSSYARHVFGKHCCAAHHEQAEITERHRDFGHGGAPKNSYLRGDPADLSENRVALLA
jgi:hypothetical protein